MCGEKKNILEEYPNKVNEHERNTSVFNSTKIPKKHRNPVIIFLITTEANFSSLRKYHLDIHH